jgi:hypothetical protein
VDRISGKKERHVASPRAQYSPPYDPQPSGVRLLVNTRYSPLDATPAAIALDNTTNGSVWRPAERTLRAGTRVIAGEVSLVVNQSCCLGMATQQWQSANRDRCPIDRYTYQALMSIDELNDANVRQIEFGSKVSRDPRTASCPRPQRHLIPSQVSGPLQNLSIDLHDMLLYYR